MYNARKRELTGLGNLLVVLTLLLLILLNLKTFPILRDLASYAWLHFWLEFLSAIVMGATVIAVLRRKHQVIYPIQLVILASGLFGVLLLDIFHTLAYQGMPDFLGLTSPERAINFWLMARALGALTFLAVAFAKSDVANYQRAARIVGFFAISLTSFLLVAGLGFANVFPRTFIEGEGLTPFKIAAEMAIVFALLTGSLALFNRYRAEIGQICATQSGISYRLMAAGVWVLMLAEIFFAVYRDVNDVFNMVGHMYKILGVVLVAASVSFKLHKTKG